MYGAARPASEVDFEEGRNLRVSALHEQLKADGAYFTQAMGWERVAHFKTDHKDVSSKPVVRDAYGTPAWLRYVDQEVKACLETVGLHDASSKAYLEVEVKMCIHFPSFSI